MDCRRFVADHFSHTIPVVIETPTDDSPSGGYEHSDDQMESDESHDSFDESDSESETS